ncbi:hypothetical protein GA0115254_109119 [Streptomyces sp. Ncost-T10-10d]|nr:hypothetical protein GA0115254_109119 [Streptomyces sp. Ncost-T10-10d]
MPGGSGLFQPALRQVQRSFVVEKCRKSAVGLWPCRSQYVSSACRRGSSNTAAPSTTASATGSCTKPSRRSSSPIGPSPPPRHDPARRGRPERHSNQPPMAHRRGLDPRPSIPRSLRSSAISSPLYGCSPWQQGPARTSVSRLWAPSRSRMIPTPTAPVVRGFLRRMQARPADWSPSASAPHRALFRGGAVLWLRPAMGANVMSPRPHPWLCSLRKQILTAR